MEIIEKEICNDCGYDDCECAAVCDCSRCGDTFYITLPDIEISSRDCVLCNDTSSECRVCTYSNLITFDGETHHICHSCINRYVDILPEDIDSTPLINIDVDVDNLASFQKVLVNHKTV